MTRTRSMGSVLPTGPLKAAKDSQKKTSSSLIKPNGDKSTNQATTSSTAQQTVKDPGSRDLQNASSLPSVAVSHILDLKCVIMNLCERIEKLEKNGMQTE